MSLLSRYRDTCLCTRIYQINALIFFFWWSRNSSYANCSGSYFDTDVNVARVMTRDTHTQKRRSHVEYCKLFFVVPLLQLIMFLTITSNAPISKLLPFRDVPINWSSIARIWSVAVIFVECVVSVCRNNIDKSFHVYQNKLTSSPFFLNFNFCTIS